MNEAALQGIARQLSHPQGEEGLKIAANMKVGNGGMIQRTIDLLACESNNTVLEIGPADGGYVPYLLSRALHLRYYGIDISETMLAQARQQHAALITNGMASFTLGNGRELPYDNDFFDKVYTVNTLYFWEEPLALLAEIKRVLKPGGRLAIGIRSKSIMEKLPFTQYGFELYDTAKATTLLQKAGFTIQQAVEEKEEVVKIMEKEFQMDRIVLVAGK
ncbi:Methyltransferase domain-containing protein [Chitinophaga rupis]|uniref:Methyltransferase domain-containing protein n=1 Tax=Chitinophaga rupis TaxID=573321 RepID=A0A1H7XFG5_9BACT|nr:class I SAM-dependent methyltransferase [Chitinophaga rupis]SEM32415.1 Methyltransferase domain-containing protein [Chitinophaga rupis]